MLRPRLGVQDRDYGQTLRFVLSPSHYWLSHISSSLCTSHVPYLVEGYTAVQALAGSYTLPCCFCSHREGLHDIIQALAGCLPTQLIAVACLAHLCTQEVKEAGRQAAAIKTPWFTTAVKQGTWDTAYACIFSTLEVETPVP